MLYELPREPFEMALETYMHISETSQRTMWLPYVRCFISELPKLIFLLLSIREWCVNGEGLAMQRVLQIKWRLVIINAEPPFYR